jgi:hypothetical protein
MRYSAIVISLLVPLFLKGQETYPGNKLPVFKQVTHPFMPTITSEYFYFTEDGLMWFSTAQGLTSFDGSEVIYYSSKDNSYELSLNNITVMEEDSQHNIYIGAGINLVYFNRKDNSLKPVQYSLKEQKRSPDYNINTLFTDKDQKLYIGFGYAGIVIYDPLVKTNYQIAIDTSTPNTCNCAESFAAHATDTNKMWVGTDNGIYLFNKKTKQLTKNFTVVNPGINRYRTMPLYFDIKKMDVINDSIIWFNTLTNGMGKYNTRSGKATLFLHDARLKQKEIWKAYTMMGFAKWKPGKYILGVSDPNPGIFDAQTGKLQLFKINNDPDAIDDVQYITNDREGNVWLLNGGLFYAAIPDYYRLNTVDISNQTTQNYLANQLGDIYFDKSVNSYFSAIIFSSGVYVLDTAFTIKKIIPVPLFTNKYTYHETSNEVITKDGSGRFWTSCLETYILLPGANKFEYAQKVFPNLSWVNSVEEVRDITTTRQGNILMRNINGTVYHIDHKTLFTDSVKMALNTEIPNFRIGTTLIYYDSLRGKMYLNDENHMGQYDFKTGKVTAISASRLLGNFKPGKGYIEYATDTEGRIWVWIPTYGIRIIDPDNINCIDSIPIGTKGFLAGTYNYLRYGGKDCMFFIGQKGVTIYNYRQQQSLLFEYSNGNAGYLPYFLGYCNNHLLLNERDKIKYFNLANFSKFKFSVNAFLNAITTGSVTVFTKGDRIAGKSINLPYNQNNLSFSFSAQEYFFPERIEYAYQLTGINSDWQYANSFNRKIQYTRLMPGKYIFRLKAQMQGGNWETGHMEYIIIITPAWWQTGWFKLLGILAGVALVIYFIQKRIQFIRKTEQQKLKHEKELLELEAKALRAQMNPHFIFNSLNSIKSLINKNENDKAAAYLTTFSKLIRTLFQNSDKREVSLYDELETCKLYTQVEQMRFGDKVDFVFDIDESIDLKDIKVPALILQPFIENAIWHGPGAKRKWRYSISLHKTNQWSNKMLNR